MSKPSRVPPALPIPREVVRPSYAKTGQPSDVRHLEAEVKTSGQIEEIRAACRLAAQALQVAREAAAVGVTNAAVDDAVHRFIVSQGGYPVGVNFHGFPRAMCSSVNNVVVHGIPDERPLLDGDIVNYDVAAFLGGAFGDNSCMVELGTVDEDGRRLCRTTREALEAAIEYCGPGVCLSGVGNIVHRIATEAGYDVVSEFVGHFLGRELHMLPNVAHRPDGVKLELRPGMVFTIEPILTEGHRGIECWPDGWTYVTADGKRAAQWEHTILVTEHGSEILTVP